MLWLVPHLFADPRLIEVAAAGLRLPGLSTLLGRGSVSREAPPGTEGALCRALGISPQHDWPLAPITLEAEVGAAGKDFWLRADPAHFQVMRDRIVLAEVGMTDLSREETDALSAAISAHFGTALPLHALHAERGYLRYAHSLHLATTPPSLAIGRALDAVMPRGEDASGLRVLMNELQMLLHAHPVNLARESRGAPPMNALWIWGGGTRPAAVTCPVHVYANGDTAAALALYCEARLHALPAALDVSMVGAPGVVLLDALEVPAQCGDASGWRERLGTLERNWFAPLAGTLHRIGTEGVSILDPIGGGCIQLRRTDAWKIWRRPRDLLSRSG
ncbi:MAG: hypothetical protein AB1593_12485 [Pseudomonadota bacterium]